MELQASGRVARVAGLLYLIVIITGIFSIAYVPSQLIVPGDGAATLAKIATAESLFRLGILAGCLCYIAFLLLPFTLYKLLGAVNKDAAVLMVALAVASVPLSFANLLNRVDLLGLLSRPELRALPAEHLHREALLSLAAYSNGILFLKIFWGLWLLPLGYLIFKSRLLPRAIGVFLIAGCLGYVIDFTGGLLVPGYAQTALARFVTLPATVGELSTCFWLLVFGIRKPK